MLLKPVHEALDYYRNLNEAAKQEKSRRSVCESSCGSGEATTSAIPEDSEDVPCPFSHVPSIRLKSAPPVEENLMKRRMSRLGSVIVTKGKESGTLASDADVLLVNESILDVETEVDASENIQHFKISTSEDALGLRSDVDASSDTNSQSKESSDGEETTCRNVERRFLQRLRNLQKTVNKSEDEPPDAPLTPEHSPKTHQSVRKKLSRGLSKLKLGKSIEKDDEAVSDLKDPPPSSYFPPMPPAATQPSSQSRTIAPAVMKTSSSIIELTDSMLVEQKFRKKSQSESSLGPECNQICKTQSRTTASSVLSADSNTAQPQPPQSDRVKRRSLLPNCLRRMPRSKSETARENSPRSGRRLFGYRKTPKCDPL